MTSLFAWNERLLWRTRFSTTEMPSLFLTQYNTIKSWQFSLFSLKLSFQSTRVHAPIGTALAQSADCMACSLQTARPPCNLQTARCGLQTARGFQIAWNISNCNIASVRYYPDNIDQCIVKTMCLRQCCTDNFKSLEKCTVAVELLACLSSIGLSLCPAHTMCAALLICTNNQSSNVITIDSWCQSVRVLC